ncbi:MAG: TRAP transporter small permease, partial [Burkholderiales bacterium]
LLLSFLVVADVIGRVVFNSPVKGTPEIVSMSIVIICFLQASYAVRSGGMLKVDVLQIALPARASAAIAAVGCLLGAAFFLVVVYGGIDPLHHAWRSNEFEGEGALRVPTWPARAAVMLGSALAAAEYLLETVQQLLILTGKVQPAQATDSVPGH